MTLNRMLENQLKFDQIREWFINDSPERHLPAIQLTVAHRNN